MVREPIWIAAWRMNRTLPTLLGVLLVLNLTVWGLTLGVVLPRQEELGRRLLGLQETLREVRSGEEAPTALEETYRAGRDDLQAFRAAIPPETGLTGLIEELFAMARQAGLEIDRVNYDPESVAGEDLRRYDLSFNVNGDYGQVKKFVYLIEHSQRLVAIEQLALNAPRKADPGSIGLRLRLTTYFRTGER